MVNTQEEQYIIGESQEITLGESPLLVKKIYTLFPALQNKNYFIFFITSLVSLIGSWLQIVAEGWLVLQMTNSAFWVGMVAALSTLPILLFSLFGGVIIDRMPKKNILVFTQSAAMFLAFVYGFLTVFHVINIFEISVLAFLLGVVSAIDMPARQSFIPKVVDSKDLGSAIALGSGAFNAARVIGPSVAGILIALTGSGGAFILNGISYIPVILALYYMSVHEVIPSEHPAPFKAIKQGIVYVARHPVIRTLLILTGITSIFGWSYSTMMPVIAKNTFHLDASGLGYLYAAGGLGAMVATVIVSSLSKKNLSVFFIFGGNVVFTIGIILFTFTTNLFIALFLLALVGVGLLSQFTTLNTTIQHMVTDEVRGRVMSIYTLIFIGFLPFGNFEIGFLSEHFGTQIAIRIGAVVVLASGIIFFMMRKKITAEYHEYKENLM